MCAASNPPTRCRRVDQLEIAELIRLLVGVAGTWIGAELLVRGSARLAISLGVRPLLVGLTVVALGTSSPEAVVSFIAAARGSASIAVGNVVGSNIANIGLILGLVSLIHPMQVKWEEIRRDVYFMVAATSVAALAIALGWMGVLAGLILIVLLLASIVSAARRPSPELVEEAGELPVVEGRDARTVGLAILQSVAGLALLIFAAQSMVQAAEAIARAFGIEEAIIGATVIAVGTSIPELAASLVAVARRHYDIGIGNLVGSNLMNLSFVLGSICLFRPGAAVAANVGQLLVPVMLGFTLLFVPMLATAGRVSRREGALLLACYLAFSWYVYFAPGQLAAG